ncbi:hypothetical protein DPMN_097001 [Dreissena polymorpha]|uniref:Uncharacterized protein n=1 Tax=Dreissena polymorpha TaxID=45954 RepID=A0A9D4R5Y9_DREPO|nr:hypothetical protein DPMN_097001 [Dreissena polymorpha]
MSRKRDVNYLIQTTASMDHALHENSLFGLTGLLLCNVERNPNEHSEALKLAHKFLYVDNKKSNYLKSIPQIPVLLDSGLKDEARKQEIVDYAFCLNASLNLPYKHVLVLEDAGLELSTRKQAICEYILKNTSKMRVQHLDTRHFLRVGEKTNKVLKDLGLNTRFVRRSKVFRPSTKIIKPRLVSI